MKISGHKTANVFRRYDITTADDVIDAMHAVELGALKVEQEQNPGKQISAKLVQNRSQRSRKSQTTRLLPKSSE